MPTLRYLGELFECTTAIKGNDYIRLLDENGVLVGSFDGIVDFSEFVLVNGTYMTPTPDHDCRLAVIRDDGTIGKGGHKCSDIINFMSGTYVGTGTVGKDQTPTKLNVGFAADVVIIQSVGDAWRGPVTFMRGCNRAISRNAIPGVLGSTELAVTWTDTGLEWYVKQCHYYSTYGDANSQKWDTPPDPTHQLNYLGTPYHWVAFGRGMGGGTNITDDGEGNVAITTNASVSINDDGNGNVVIV